LVSASAKANLSAFVKRLDLLISAGVLALFLDSLRPIFSGGAREAAWGSAAQEFYGGFGFLRDPWNLEWFLGS
jgi:hypothetical protein